MGCCLKESVEELVVKEGGGVGGKKDVYKSSEITCFFGCLKEERERMIALNSKRGRE